MAQDNKLQKNNQPTSSVSNFQLKLSYWYINNKLRLRQALVIFLICLSLVFYGFTFYRAVTIVFIDDRNLSRNLQDLTDNSIDYTYFHRANAPQDIKILSFDATDGRDNRFDFVAKIANPNLNFSALQVDLVLATGSQIVANKSTFVLPGEEKLVVFFGQQLDQLGSPTLRIAQADWHRQRGYQEFAQSRLNFITSDADFKPAGSSFSAGQAAVSTLNFKLKNNSAFSYWQVGVYAGLISGGSIVAANYITLDQFLAGETREVEMRWYERLPAITDFEIYPEVNILDESSYMSVQ